MPADWTALTSPQLHALAMLSFAMPVHAGYGKRRLGIKYAAIRALERRGLVGHTYLYHGETTVPVPFWTLTRSGDATRCEYINFHRRMLAEIGTLPPELAAIASLQI